MTADAGTFLTHRERKSALEALLLAHQGLWRPQPFKEETPAWCGEHPALTAELLALDDEAVARLEGDNAALIGWLGGFVPALLELAGLIDFPPSPASGTIPQGAGRLASGGAEQSEGWGLPHRGDGGERRLTTDIPGRKEAQIFAYAEAMGPPRAPLLEWCAGKGHLGRLLAHRWHWPVASLEIDAALCTAGEGLARHAHVDCLQHFLRTDALAEASTRHLSGRHAVALHACGDLHTRMVAGAVAEASPAIDLAPCCYYRTVHATYRPFTESALTLSRDDLRLAVTETVTASAKQRERSRRALAWKLGWVELRRALTGEAGYRPFPPVPEAWLRGTFAEFVGKMSGRSAPPPHPSPADGGGQGGGDLPHFEALGHARAARMLRLQLVRLAFRRALEVWLVMDMACFLEGHGYAVRVGAFCPASLTPRNLLLSARRRNL